MTTTLRNKILAAFLSLAMIFSSLILFENQHHTHAAGSDCTSTESCTGSYGNTGFCSYCGGYEQPPHNGSTYYASNAGHLFWFAEAINSTAIRYDCDLYIENDIKIPQPLPFDWSTHEFVGDTSKLIPWIPIGLTTTNTYGGTIYGNGHVISGLYCNDDSLRVSGLVGFGSGTEIYDLTITESVFVGHMVEMEDDTYGFSPAAPFLADTKQGKLVGCVSYATVYSNGGAGGGLIGIGDAVTVLHSAAFGHISAHSEYAGTGTAIGGLIGYSVDHFAVGEVYRCTLVENSVNMASVVALSSEVSVGQISGASYGGVYTNVHYLNENDDPTYEVYGKIEGYSDSLGYRPPDIEKTYAFKSADARNGTLCERIGGHLYSDSACVFCYEQCTNHTWENENCTTCGLGITFVRDIDAEIPTKAFVGDTFTLAATVSPSNATFRDLVWSVVSGPATVSAGSITFTNAGTVTLKATVKDGLGLSKDYTETYTVEVNSRSEIDVSKISGAYWAHRLLISEVDNALNLSYTDKDGEVSVSVPLGTQIVLTGSNTGSAYARVEIAANCNHPVNLKLKNVTLSNSDQAILDIQSGSTLHLTLEGTNNLTALVESGYAAVTVRQGASLIIDGTGTLNAKGVAGIGSAFYNDSTGNITINGGTVNAEATGEAAGIGSGNSGKGGNITINGGTVTAKGGRGAAGIGSGPSFSSTAGNITINGGVVNAYGSAKYSTSNTGGAGIGGGREGEGGTITINGGTIYAKGGYNSAGIGGGDSGNVDAITINGGTVTAEGHHLGAGIGGGLAMTGGNIVFTGGNIKARSESTNGVGSGGNTNQATSVTDGKGNNVTLVTYTLDGMTEATAIRAISGIGSYGLTDVKTLDTNQLYLYLPAETTATSVSAGETTYPCNRANTFYTAHSYTDGVCECGEECKHIGESGSSCSNCGKQLHTHSWRFTVNGTTLTATCTAEGCTYENGHGGSVTLHAPDVLVYNGTSADATLSSDGWMLETPTVSYNGIDRVNVTGSDIVATLSFSSLDTDGQLPKVSYRLVAKEIAADDVSVTNSIYTALVQTPTIVVGGLTLGTDYTLTWDNEGFTEVGEYRYTVKGIGNYQGKVEGVYTISWLDTDLSAEVSGTKGNDGWYVSSVTIKAPEGMLVSLTVDGIYTETITRTENVTEAITYIYLVNAKGQIARQAVSIKIDVEAPTGTVTLTDGTTDEDLPTTVKTAQALLAESLSVLFDSFYKNAVTVEVSASDRGAGLDKVQYYRTAASLTTSDLKDITDWKDVPENGVILDTLVNGEQFVYYVKLTDKAGNVTYLASNGAVYDTTPPVISGITDGDVLYHPTTGTATDDNLDFVTVTNNTTGETVTLRNEAVPAFFLLADTAEGITFTIPGNTDATFTVVATDKAGNSATLTVTVKSYKTVIAETEDITEKNVTAENDTDLEKVISILDEAIAQDPTLSDEQKAELEDARDDAQKLLDHLKEAHDAIATEDIEKAAAIDEEAFTLQDKETLESAKKDLEDALSTYDGNYTDEERKLTTEELERITSILEEVEKVEDLNEQIEALPETITEKDLDTVDELADRYEALPDHSKSLLDPDNVAALESAVDAAEKLREELASPDTSDSVTVLAAITLCGGIALTAILLPTRKKKQD